jgi:type II secretory pathway pseudopilin PulG
MGNREKGFSLLELLIYMALLAMILPVIAVIFLSVNSGRVRNEVRSAVNSNLRFAVEKIADDLRAATSVTTPASGGASSTALGTWATTTPLPQGNRYAGAAAYNNYLYSIGGDGDVGIGNQVYFAPINSTGSLGNWTSTTNLPSVLIQMGVDIYNGYMYVIGGATSFAVSNFTSTVLYAPINATGSIGNWTRTAGLPIIDAFPAFNETLMNNGYLYSIAGTSLPSGSQTSTVNYAPINGDGTVGNWTSTKAWPVTGGFAPAAAVNNGYAYTNGGGSVSTMFFAPINSTGSLGNWTSTTAAPIGLEYSSAAVANNNLYLVGGDETGANSSSRDVFYASFNSTGSLGAWATSTPLLVPTASHAAVSYNGYMYAIGGDPVGDGSTTSTVQYAPINPTVSRTLTLTTPSDTITFCVVSGVLRRQTGGGACTAASDAITDNTVVVATSTFTRLQNANTILHKTIVSVQVDLGLTYNGNSPDQQYSEEKITAVSPLSQ